MAEIWIKISASSAPWNLATWTKDTLCRSQARTRRKDWWCR